jgi:hypothetical protein
MMNTSLQRYLVGTEFPEASGAEQLEMLQVRDRLLEEELALSNEERELLAKAVALSNEERELLAKADRHLIQQAPQVLLELSRFVDLAAQRRNQDISAERWWWYLDVLTQMRLVLDRASVSAS